VVESSVSVASVVWISAGVGLGVGGATAPVEWISPARDAPVSTHARATASAKRLIFSVSPLTDASRLAKKQDSVNTYEPIDTTSRAVTNIRRWQLRLLILTDKGFIFREDGLT
jgi:hypothetical protein